MAEGFTFGADGVRRIVETVRAYERNAGIPPAKRRRSGPTSGVVWQAVKPTAEQSGYWDGVLSLPTSTLGTMADGADVEIYSAVGGLSLDVTYQARLIGVNPVNGKSVWLISDPSRSVHFWRNFRGASPRVSQESWQSIDCPPPRGATSGWSAMTYWIPYFEGRGGEIDRIACLVYTAPSVARNVRMAIYENLAGGDEVYPGARLGSDTGNVSVSNDQVYAGTVSVSLEKGSLYWLAITHPVDTDGRFGVYDYLTINPMGYGNSGAAFDGGTTDSMEPYTCYYEETNHSAGLPASGGNSLALGRYNYVGGSTGYVEPPVLWLRYSSISPAF